MDKDSAEMIRDLEIKIGALEVVVVALLDLQDESVKWQFRRVSDLLALNNTLVFGEKASGDTVDIQHQVSEQVAAIIRKVQP